MTHDTFVRLGKNYNDGIYLIGQSTSRKIPVFSRIAENDIIYDWAEATGYFLKDTMTLLKVQPMVDDLQNLVDKIRWTRPKGPDLSYYHSL